MGRLTNIYKYVNVTPATVDSFIASAYDVAKKYTNARCAYIGSAYGQLLPLVTYSVHTLSNAQPAYTVMPHYYDETNPPKTSVKYFDGDSISYTGGQITMAFLDLQKSWQRPIHNLSVSLQNLALEGGIEYSVKSGARESAVFRNGEVACIGFVSSATKIDKLRIKLTGAAAEHFSVQYRVSNDGHWTSWACDGEYAGSDSNVAILRIQIRIVKKDEFHLSGDINDDGRVNSFDLAELRLNLLGMLEFSEDASERADIDGNGRIDAHDILWLKLILLGSIPQY